MAGTLNKVILVGNLGKDPEVRFMPDGSKVTSFSLATGEVWKDKTTGERKEKTEWHRITIFNERIVEIVSTVFFTLLIILMIFVVFNDITLIVRK